MMPAYSHSVQVRNGLVSGQPPDTAWLAHAREAAHTGAHSVPRARARDGAMRRAHAMAAEGRSAARRPGRGRVGDGPRGLAAAAASSLPDRTR